MSEGQAAFIDEACTLFSSDCDYEFQRMKRVTEISKDVSEIVSERELAINQSIAALTEKCEELEQEMITARKPDTKLENFQQQLQEQQAFRNKVKEQLQEIKIKEKEEESIQQDIEKKKSSNDVKLSKALPTLRHDVNLYNYVSCVRWQYNAPDNQVKGYIANGKNVHTFDLDKTQNSKFFITNYLWDLMEPDW